MLRNLQQRWKNYILDQSQIDFILPDISMDAEQRLGIYAGAYEARLLEAMTRIFPFLQAYMGEDQFDEYAVAYLIQTPSRYYSVSKIGEKFSSFLEQLVKNKLYSELAALEWAISTAIESADAKALTQAALQEIPQDKWAEMRLTTDASLCLLKFSTPALEIYQNNINNNINIINSNINYSQTYCRVWRKGIQVYYLGITETEYTFLENLQHKILFGEICEKLAEIMPEQKVIEYALFQLLQWLSDGIIIKAEIDS